MISSTNEERIGHQFKGLPADAEDLTLAELAGQRRPLFSGGFSWPAMTIRLSTVEHNAALMAEYARSHSLQIAPHLKTSMSPRLAMIAEANGIWGVTVATPFQAQVFLAAGADSIFLANELVESDFARQVSAWQQGQDHRFLCYVDSVHGVEILDAHAQNGLDVVLEIGHAGGRAGVRTLPEAAAVARAVKNSRHLRLRGAGGYEGSVAHERDAEGLHAVRSYLRMLADAVRLVATDCVPGAPIVVSAGGSLYFDCVAEILAPEQFPGLDVITIIRSGAYLTHDSDFYARRSPLDGDLAQANAGAEGVSAAALPDRLLPSIEVWGQVLSRPEPSLVIVGAGRRDVNTDSGMPVPVRTVSAGGTDSRLLRGWQLYQLNDQHAFIEVPTEDPAQPGDLVALAISHPCTLHQRWSAPLLLDDEDRVVDIARSYF